MSEYKIRTNHKARELVCLANIKSKKVRDWFDYIEADSDEAYSPRFVKYLGTWYDVNEFSTLRETQMARTDAPDVFKGWDAYQGDSYFSGVVMKWAKNDAGRDDFEAVILGTYTS